MHHLVKPTYDRKREQPDVIGLGLNNFIQKKREGERERGGGSIYSISMKSDINNNNNQCNVKMLQWNQSNDTVQIRVSL